MNSTSRIRLNHLSKPIALIVAPLYIQLLRLAWLIGFLYAEVWSFASAASLRNCSWREKTEDSASYFNILLLADPQIPDQFTYPHLPRTISRVLEWFADQYVRRAYRALIRANASQKSRKDGLNSIIWMGDITDGGRREQTTDEWEALHTRFDSLIQRDIGPHHDSTISSESEIPTFFISGNHDVGLPLASGQAAGKYSNPFSSPKFLERYGTPIHDFQKVLRLFVPPNTTMSSKLGPSKKKSINVRMPIFVNGNDKGQSPTHELILIDSQALIGMHRIGGPFQSLESHTPGEFNGKLREKAMVWHKETYDFVESLKSEKGPSLNRILVTHVPLYRPPPHLDSDKLCDLPFRSSVHGVSRTSKNSEDGLIQGTDRDSTFQNLISFEVSEWLLETIQPSLIFSGDDHNHCEVLHTLLHSVQSQFDREGKKRPTVEIEGFSENLIDFTTPELTLKAFGINNPTSPGFSRLSLSSKPIYKKVKDSNGNEIEKEENSIGISYKPCKLPDQIKLYSAVYPFLLLFTFGILIWKNGNRRRGRGKGNDEGYEMLGGAEVEKKEEEERRRKRLENEERDDDDDDDDEGEISSSSLNKRNKMSLNERFSNFGRDFFEVLLIALPLWILVQWF